MEDIVIFGDIHFNDERAWSLEVSNNVIEYLNNDCKHNNSNHIGVFLGDITEKASISPLVYELLFKFLSALRFRKTYILMGNHDKKKKRDRLISPLSFLQMEDSPYPNVKLISDPARIVEKFPLIFLPYKSHSEALSMSDYSENLNPLWYEDKDALILGHFADTSDPNVRESSIDLTKFKGEVVLGHIHNPISSHYIGSVIPNAYSEKAFKRYYRVYSSNKEYKEIEIPSLLEYVNAEFPKPLPKVKTLTPVYTIYNCQSLEAALKYYPNIYIRKCMYENIVDADSFSKALALTSEKSLSSTVDIWLTSQETLSSSIKEKVKSYLKATN